MCMWMIPYHIATAHIHIGQAFRSYLECWIPPEDKTKQSFLVEALTHSRWLPHQCQTHKMCFTTSVCYGCAYGWVLTTLPLLALTKLLEVTYDSGCLGGLKEFRLPPKDQTKESFVVEAIDTFKITLPLHQCQTSYYDNLQKTFTYSTYNFRNILINKLKKLNRQYTVSQIKVRVGKLK